MSGAHDPLRTSLPSDETSWRFMFKVSSPMVVATVSYTLMQFVDRLMVAHYSREALAAVLPASMVGFVPSSLMLGVMTTVNTFVSQCYGRKVYRDCSHYCWQAVYLGLAYTCCTFVVIWPLARPIFALMSQPEAIIPLEVIYLRIMLVGQFVVVFIWATNQFFMGVHRAEVTMITALIGQIVNVLTNYVLIFGKFGFPEMGIAGAAWGTVIGAAVNALTRTFWFVSPATHRQFRSRSTWGCDLHKIWDLLKIGAPAGFAFCVNTSFVGALLFALIGRFGADALAATSATYSCTTVSFMPVVGMGVALTAVVGKSIGRGDKEAAAKQTRRTLLVAVLYMGAVGVGLYLFRHEIISIWNLNGTASALGAKLLICAAVFQVFDAVLLTYTGALRGAGDTLWLGLVTAAGAVFILGLGGGAIVTWLPQWGAIGPWIAYTLHVVFVGLANCWRFRSKRWHKIDLFQRQVPSVSTPEIV